MTSFVCEHVSKLTAYGDVFYLPDFLDANTAGEKRYLAKTFGRRRHVVTFVICKDENGNIISYFGRCSCGHLQSRCFSCNHHKTVAIARNIDEDLLIPPQLSTAGWLE